MRVFIAAPFFNARERAFNKELATFLRGLEFVDEVWIAQEHEFLGSNEDNKKRIFEVDLDALRRCDVVVAMLDGECVDSGTAFELGCAHALKKPVIGIKTDYRTFSAVEELNLMVEVSLRKLIKAKDVKDVKEKIRMALKEVWEDIEKED